MNIKQPAAYDTSYYEIVPDFSKVFPRPLIVFTKATEGSSIRDPKFLTYWADLKQDGIRRGCYHFHRKAVTESAQAMNFINTVQVGGVTASDIFVIDIEEGGESATQIIAWLDIVEAVFPNNRIMIYSRKNILDPIVMTLTQITRLKKYKIWTAGYPNNPDLISSPPADYIPNQAKWGEVWMWQYTESAIIQGIAGEVDANWLAPEFIALLGGAPSQPSADTITHPYNGIERISGTRYGWKFELFRCDPAQVRFESVCNSPLTQVSTVAKSKGAQIGLNGGEWDRISNVKDYTVSNGRTCHLRSTFAPSLMITGDNKIELDNKLFIGVKQAFSGLRYLVQGGVIDPLLDGTEAKYTEGHSRTIYGIDSHGYLLAMVSEGIRPTLYTWDGMTLKETAQIMKQYGVITAADFGGGGDSTVWMGGKLLLMPENPNGEERYLPNVFMIYAQESTMTNGTAKEILGNTTVARVEPSRYAARAKDAGGNDITYPPLGVVNFIAEALSQPTGALDFPTDLWLETPEHNYINYKLTESNGIIKSYYTILTQPADTPPVTGDIALDMTLKSDGTIAGTWKNT